MGDFINKKDSSMNILDILNDDCIGEIFRRVEHVEDLANAASTCKRFRECTMSLKFLFRSLSIESTHHPNSRTNAISAHSAPTFLRHFGRLVESVEWELAGNQKHEDEIFELLAKYCGKTLKKLRIKHYNPNFNKGNTFSALEHLLLYNAEPINFYLDSPLKHLEIHSFPQTEGEDLENQYPWFVRDFPYLKSVHLNSTKVNDETLTEFLSLNGQLLVLSVSSEYLTPMVFESIGYYLRDIERLQIDSANFRQFENSEFHKEWLHLSALRKLSELNISGCPPLGMLFKMFVENDTPIWSLEVDIAATENASSFPSIKTLNNLQCICRSDVDENCLINLVKSQTALQTLEVVNMGAKITVGTIEKILKFGKNLKHFDVLFCDGDIDLYSYNRMLMLARSRAVVVRLIVSKRRQVSVPTDVLQINRKWLRIRWRLR